MSYRNHRKSSRGKVDTGSSWISYSDMMAALLLVFVLVLCYSMVQYFQMLETKTAELDAQSALLTAQEEQLGQQKSQLDEQKTQLETQKTQLDTQKTQLEQQATALAQQESTLQSQASELETQRTALQSKEEELETARAQIESQQTEIDSQNLELEEKEQTLQSAQATLSAQQSDLAALQQSLASKQTELDSATALLSQQQLALQTQQQRLDDLVGVRTHIVRDLTSALLRSSISASVDQNTGDIVLESTVFFDVNKNTIKQEGQEFLNRFIPVYLGVLLQPEYETYLGEIIIEGHTDPTGTYLHNLKLSQERALSVATYCLEMPSLTEAQRDKLQDILTATGRSYADPVYNAAGEVDMDASRRVEFKFRLRDSEMIDEMRDILAGYSTEGAE